MKSQVRQYGELAKYYDLIYSWKDYDGEAEVLREVIGRYKRSPGESLLDVGCGTGQHIKRLRQDFDCVGIDVNEEMLGQARRNVKGVKFVQGDMVDFDLGREFDVVLCLFSAVGHLQSRTALDRTMSNFAKHLKRGGVAVIEPWLTRSTAKDGHIQLLVEGSDRLKIARAGYSTVKGDKTVLDMRILVAERGKGISSYRDRMVMTLFEKGEVLESMRKAGLLPRYLRRSLAPGRGLYVGVKP